MPINPNDPGGYWPLLLNVFDVAGGTLIASVGSVITASHTRQAMQPFQDDITLMLEDATAANIAMGQYYELMAGDDAYVVANGGVQQKRYNGYIQSVQRSVDAAGAYEIIGASPAIKLDDEHGEGNQTFDPHIFSSIIDVLNGVQNPAGSGIYPPGYRGILTTTGRKAVWKDGNRTPAATTTTSGAATGSNNTTGQSQLHVASTSGMTSGNWLQVGGTLSFTITGIIDGTHVGIYPPLNANVAASTTVSDLGYTPVGLGDKSKRQWSSDLLDLTTICSHYGVMWSDAPASENPTRTSGNIYVGPLGDDSGLTVWGGEPLRARQQTNYGFAVDVPNAALAQEMGDAIVDTVTYTEDFSHVKNLYWLTGKGSPDKGGITLQPLVGGSPFDDSGGSPSSPINGWSTYQPDVSTGGRLFFVKAISKTTYDGRNFEFIALQRIGHNMFQFGVIDRGTSVGTNNPPPFGVAEDFLHVRQISDDNWLLAAGIGHLLWNSTPVPSYEWTVRHPMTSGAVPALPRPGQKVTINYQGDVEAMAYDTNPTSITYGQLVPSGNYVFLDYPPTGMLTTDPRYAKLQHAVIVTEEWDSDGTYTQTLTTGRGKWHSKYWADQVAREMETHVHSHDHPSNHHFQEVDFNGHHGYLSQGAPGGTTGWADEDRNNKTLRIWPSGFFIYSVTSASQFGDNHAFAFTFQITDNTQALRLVFCKAVDSKIASLASNGQYGGFQIAGTGSGLTSKFYVTSNGTTLTYKGKTHASPIFDGNGCVVPGTYSAYLKRHGNKYDMLITAVDAKISNNVLFESTVATWNDYAVQLTSQGSMGWTATGGTNPALIWGVHAIKHHASPPPKKSVTRGHGHPHTPATKSRKKTTADPNGHPIIRITPVAS